MRRSGRLLGALLAATTLSGCGTLQGAADALDERPRPPYQSPTLAAAEDLMPAMRDFTYAMASLGVPDCAMSPRPDRQQGRDGKPGGPTTSPTVQCRDRAANGVSTANIDAFLNSSIFVIDANSASYMDSLSSLSDTSRWTRSQFNTVANYVGVLMALAGQPSVDLGYLNAATGFFNASADNLETFVLISPTPGKLTPLVRTAQTQHREELDAVRVDDEHLRWSNTARWIEEYAELCTPRGIRGLLDVAIDSVAVGGSVEALRSAADRVAPDLNRTLNSLPAFAGLAPDVRHVRGSDRLGAISWLVREGTGLSFEQRAFIEAKLGADFLSALDDALKAPSQRQALEQVISEQHASVFTELQNAVQADWASGTLAKELADAQAAARNAAEATNNANAEAAARQERITRLEDQLRNAGLVPVVEPPPKP